LEWGERGVVLKKGVEGFVGDIKERRDRENMRSEERMRRISDRDLVRFLFLRR